MKRRKYTETPAGQLKPPRPVATSAFTRPVFQGLNAPCV